MINRHSGCPLCGGKLSASELLDACEEFADLELGVLAARCPFCQGLLEIRPVAGGLEIGYVAGNAGSRRFDLAFSLPLPGLTVDAGEATGLQLHAPRQSWFFGE